MRCTLTKCRVVYYNYNYEQLSFALGLSFYSRFFSYRGNRVDDDYEPFSYPHYLLTCAVSPFTSCFLFCSFRRLNRPRQIIILVYVSTRSFGYWIVRPVHFEEDFEDIYLFALLAVQGFTNMVTGHYPRNQNLTFVHIIKMYILVMKNHNFRSI